MSVVDRIQAVQGDITRQDVDAIVNAANTTLLGGGGVDGAIHRAAGPGLLEECRSLGGCPTGQARITAGYDLPARFVIHTVGPVWNGGKSGEPDLLASCYRASLALARSNDVQTIAFPAISTGAYRFPIQMASAIAVREVVKHLTEHRLPRDVRFVCFDDNTLSTYEASLTAAKLDA
ncbi:MAG: O-acetyl-ADP-ribose deacetylase [Rhodothermales bacterium]|nr:O-acetyl-ADP-ribose deacetylase [Rhodothermales bacterium]